MLLKNIRNIWLLLVLLSANQARGGFYEGFIHYEQGNYEQALPGFRTTGQWG